MLRAYSEEEITRAINIPLDNKIEPKDFKLLGSIVANMDLTNLRKSGKVTVKTLCEVISILQKANPADRASLAQFARKEVTSEDIRRAEEKSQELGDMVQPAGAYTLKEVLAHALHESARKQAKSRTNESDVIKAIYQGLPDILAVMKNDASLLTIRYTTKGKKSETVDEQQTVSGIYSNAMQYTGKTEKLEQQHIEKVEMEKAVIQEVEENLLEDLHTPITLDGDKLTDESKIALANIRDNFLAEIDVKELKKLAEKTGKQDAKKLLKLMLAIKGFDGEHLGALGKKNEFANNAEEHNSLLAELDLGYGAKKSFYDIYMAGIKQSAQKQKGRSIFKSASAKEEEKRSKLSGAKASNEGIFSTPAIEKKRKLRPSSVLKAVISQAPRLADLIDRDIRSKNERDVTMINAYKMGGVSRH